MTEEDLIVETILRYAHRGYVLEREDLLDCVEIIVQHMPEEKRRKLPFIDGRPSPKFARSLERRHKNSIKFARTSPQEAKGFAATNAQNLTSYIAELEAVIEDHSIDSKRIINLDETGVSPDKDAL